jgi:hypothetical protein
MACKQAHQKVFYIVCTYAAFLHEMMCSQNFFHLVFVMASYMMRVKGGGGGGSAREDDS